jgi:hypothetical protein
MNQVQKSQGWEGWLAPAVVECHSISGGKPPFLTLRFCRSSCAAEFLCFFIMSSK